METTEQPGLVSDEFLKNFEIYMTCWFTLAVTVPGIVFNTIVILVFRKQGYRDNMNISLTAIAVWDLLKSLSATAFRLYGPAYLFSEAVSESWRNIGFTSVAYTYVHCTHVSFALAAYVSFERYICVSFPLKIKRILTPRVTLVSVTLISTVLFISFGVVHFFYEVHWEFDPKLNTTIAVYENTGLYNDHKIVVNFYSLINILVPTVNFIIIVICTSLIARRLRESQKFRERFQVRPNLKGPIKSISDGIDHLSKTDHRRKRHSEAMARKTTTKNPTKMIEDSDKTESTELDFDSCKDDDVEDQIECSIEEIKVRIDVEESPNSDKALNDLAKKGEETFVSMGTEKISPENNVSAPQCADSPTKQRVCSDETLGVSTISITGTVPQLADSPTKHNACSPEILGESTISIPGTVPQLADCPTKYKTCNDENLDESIIRISEDGSNEPCENQQTRPTRAQYKGSMSSGEQQTIRMLLVLLLVYILVFIPRVLLYIGSIIEPEFYVLRRYNNVFMMCASVLHFFDFINADVNLFIFLRMSTQFRRTFKSMFSCSG